MVKSRGQVDSLGSSSNISEEKPGGEEVKEKKEEEKASKLMWNPQKADPDNLDHHIVKLRPKRSSVITTIHQQQSPINPNNDTLLKAIARKAMPYTRGRLMS